MLARLAVVDPELTYGLPQAVTASTGMDALTQLIEPYVSLRANPMTESLCVEGMRRVARGLHRACVDGRDAEARQICLWPACSRSGACQCRPWAVHGFAAPIGGAFHAPHGAVCAAMLPNVMAANIKLCAPASRTARRSPDTGGRRNPHRPLRGMCRGRIEWVNRLCQDLRIPALALMEFGHDDVPELVENASKASSMKGNPIALSLEELQETLSRLCSPPTIDFCLRWSTYELGTGPALPGAGQGGEKWSRAHWSR